MARLNEPPQPAIESIDALKRRFVRQNREIARANSIQSVRIRNLECEVSQLLGENVSLREEIIRFQHEAERNSSKDVLEGVQGVKGKLEAKLSELGSLLQELGDVPKTANTKRAQKRRSINRSSPKRSPDQRIWKNTLTLSEAVGGADGRLPPIVEDKYYPRRTMDAEELLEIMADPTSITDSPDLGPPPVAHFEQGDPIKFDSPRDEQSKQPLSTNDEDAHPRLSANLETRKKRRESSHRREGDLSRPISDSTKKPPSRVSSNPDQPLKSGAKRKLNVREEEERTGPRESRDESGVQSSQRDAEYMGEDGVDAKPAVNDTGKPSINKPSSSAPPLNNRDGKDKPVEVPPTKNTSNRRVLGPKSVNSDPMNSPLKHQRANSKDKVADAKDDLARIIRERSRSKDKAHIKAVKQPEKNEDPPKPAIPPVTRAIAPPPETPIPPPNELFSPTGSEPSARGDSRDTPPPPDLGPDTGTGSFGRASRRPRGAVNYAQPNLRDKMRRPTAELVDAVAAEERARQADIAKAKAEKEAADAVVVKQEDVADELPIWKTEKVIGGHDRGLLVEEPASPLSSKTSESSKDLPPSVITERRRRTVLPSHNDDEAKARPSGSNPLSSGAASAITALTVNNRRAKRNEDGKLEISLSGEDGNHDQGDRPSIYDFAGSSPNMGTHAEGEAAGKEKEVAKPARSSRRHSTAVPATSDQSRGTLSISRRTGGDRRRESILGATGRKDDNAGTSLARTKSVLDLGVNGEKGGEEAAAGRGERAANRRRSMML